jgi:chorismate synthase
MLRFLTAGESHGQALVAILEGMPAGLSIDFRAITTQLRRRQTGYGRGPPHGDRIATAPRRSAASVTASTGAPIALQIPNKDWENWQRTMHVEATMPEGATGADRPDVTRPRPGHADLAGFVKYGHDDMRNVLERASARETAARVAVGAIARSCSQVVGLEIVSHVTASDRPSSPIRSRFASTRLGRSPAIAAALRRRRRRAADDRGNRSRARCRRHDGRQLRGDRARGPAGLGSHVQWDRKLDGRSPGADVDSRHQGGRHRPRPAVATVPGSTVHDEILPGRRQASVPLRRPTNNAGGLEGGVTNGEDLRVTGYMKPISTLMKPLRSVDLATMTESPAAIERSDVCAVPPPPSSAKRWSRSSSPTRSSKNSAAIRRRAGGELAGLQSANRGALCRRP